MFVYTLLNWEVAGWCHSLLHGHGHGDDVVDKITRSAYVSRVICCLRHGRTYICRRCQYGPVIWLGLLSLSAPHARSLITTELSPCVMITESPCHSKCSRDRQWLLWGGLYTLGIASVLFFLTVHSWGISLWIMLWSVPFHIDISYRCMCVLSTTPWP